MARTPEGYMADNEDSRAGEQEYGGHFFILSPSSEFFSFPGP